MDAITIVQLRLATSLSALTCIVAPGCTAQDRDLPACPSGDWCGDAEAAKLLAPEAAPAAPAQLGCPPRLDDPTDEKRAQELTADPRLASFPFAGGAVVATLDEDATKAARSQPGGESQCCYRWVERCPGGRPLLVEREAVTAELHRGGPWSEPVALADVPTASRRELARGWLDDALAEHASVASFARFTLELMALGAPPRLLAASQQAGLDEVDHASACFSIASALLGPQKGPGPLPSVPMRAPTFAQLAHDTFVEGCVAESVAALLAERLARHCRIPAIANVWHRIAKDEAAHAALGWAALSWASSQDEEGVRPQVRRAVESLRPRSDEAHPRSDEHLLGFGRPDAATLWEVRRDAWAHLIDGELRRLGLG